MIDLLCGIKISAVLVWFVTKHVCDRQTDGQNCDSQDRTNIAASRGKNMIVTDVLHVPFCPIIFDDRVSPISKAISKVFNVIFRYVNNVGRIIILDIETDNAIGYLFIDIDKTCQRHGTDPSRVQSRTRVWFIFNHSQSPKRCYCCNGHRSQLIV